MVQGNFVAVDRMCLYFFEWQHNINIQNKIESWERD